MPSPDDEPLDLLEHRRVRQVQVVAAIDLTGHDNPHWRLVALHIANLHRRGVRAEERGRPAETRDLAGEIQGVLHIPRRMLGGHVERFEVVVIVLDLGAFEHLIAEACENRLDLLAHDCQRMAMPDQRRTSRQRDVDRAGGRFRGIERGSALAEPLLEFLLELVGGLAEYRFHVGRRRGHRLHQRGDEAVLSSEVFVAEGLKIRFRGNTRRFLLELGAQSGNVGVGRHTRRGLRGP